MEAATSPLVPFADSDFEHLLAMVAQLGDGWEQCSSPGDEVDVWCRADPTNKAVMMLRCCIRVPSAKALDPEDILAVWRDIDYRWTWDGERHRAAPHPIPHPFLPPLRGAPLTRPHAERCVVNTVHSSVGDDEVGYYEASAPAPLSNRDFVLQCGYRTRFQGRPEWLTVNKSVSLDDVPPKKGIVRAISYVTGTKTELHSDGSVTVTYLTSGDAGGWLPKAVVNLCVGRGGGCSQLITCSVIRKAGPGMMRQMVEAALGYKAWKAKKSAEGK